MSTDTRMNSFHRAALVLAVVGLSFAGWQAGEPALRAQTGGALKFTNASVTRSQGFVNVHPTVADGRFTWQAAPLIVAIAYAYETSLPAIDRQMPLEPLYDIDATFPASATPRDIKEMLKHLLIDRFALRVRHETRRIPHFKLVPEAGGHKLGAAASRTVLVSGSPLQPGRIANSHVSAPNGWQFAGARVTVRQIADAFANGLQLPVIDATGINGTFDVDIVQARANDRTFFEAVSRQLGLRLEQAIGDVDVLVIDEFTMP